jgi:MYXO-CTERM domain-containing protein
MRGRQVMEALAAVHPNIVVLFTFANGGATLYPKPDGTSYFDLLPPFLDGFLDAVAALPASGPRPRLIDGYESSYGFRTAAEFAAARARIKTSGRALSQVPALYDQFLQAGFANWIDNYSRYHDCSMKREWSTSNLACNWFTPAEFQEAIRQALTHADPDSYVWVYTQVPNWWTGAQLPDAYASALRDGKAQYLAALPPEPDAGAPPAPDAAADAALPADAGVDQAADTIADAGVEAIPADAPGVPDATADMTTVADARLDAAPPADAPPAPDAAPLDAATKAPSSSGCSCSIEGAARGPGATYLVLLVLAGARRWRRRRATATSSSSSGPPR